ncbi:GbsR/MarR family transcriptional regulator [Tenuibacillus multivorans]|uniref:HTH-type transcriptional regulator n=1 Tax=Tenuibacillus multivorans TaxID=237069 RepID=A0A1G9WN96_9BACI|nr:transcriptional regulator [Tenuibacillus multivorans]GEL77996.1 HTH-type transcriptional repressor GbsR [Tenuibacillus multivorans]SDM85978.1 DNA-binding transcriptional regulator GbsR, MarR family [Tenuibacillus multivorans]
MSESDHKEKLQESQDVIVSAIAQSMVIYGVTPSVGRIYGVLYFSDEPLTLDDIKDQVAMSKASVSNGIRELMETEMVTKVWKKGERKDHFIAEKDFLKNFLNFFVKMIRLERSLITKAIDQTEPVIQEIANDPDSDEAGRTANRDLELISGAKDYLDWIMRLANTLESREIFNLLPKDK